MEPSFGKARIAIMLAIGLIAISFSSILIKLCLAPSLVIAAYRLVIASIFYVVLARFNAAPVWRSFSWTQRKIAVISGLFLTLHFAAWISSLKYTSVASSVVLVQSAPVFVALGSFLILKEKPSLRMLIGILITLIGSIVISIYDFSGDQNSIIGNLLAVGGAVGAAGYMVAGRRLRASVDTLRYVTAVYSVAAIMLLAFSISSGASFVGYNFQTYLLFLGIAVFPQIIGHTVINWSLKIFTATTVSIIILAEPIGASILAFSLLGEKLAPVKIAGGFVIIVGVIVVLLAETGQKRTANSKINEN